MVRTLIHLSSTNKHHVLSKYKIICSTHIPIPTNCDKYEEQMIRLIVITFQITEREGHVD